MTEVFKNWRLVFVHFIQAMVSSLTVLALSLDQDRASDRGAGASASPPLKQSDAEAGQVT